MYDIFLSYARENLERARQLAAALEALGWTVFWDQYIPPGKTWQDVIGVALQEARCVIVCWSEISIRKDWVREEAEEGKSRKILVPVLLDKVMPPMGFRSIQAANLVGWEGDTEALQFRQLVTAIGDILGPSKQPSASLAPEPEPDPVPKFVQKPEPLFSPESPAISKPTPSSPVQDPVPPKPPVTPPPPPPSKAAPTPARPAETEVSTRDPGDRGKLKPASAFWIVGLLFVIVMAGFMAFQLRNPPQVLEPKMVAINGGCFQMGSPESEEEREGDERQHKVCVSDFAIGEHEVTFAEYDRYAQATNREFPGDEGWGRGDRPVIDVSWNDAVAYTEWLREKIGKAYRLPTEAEWEYAARAGTTTPFSFGENITPEQVNYNGNLPYAGGKKGQYREKTVPVKTLPPNPWGLYEMHGNVWEWCQDWYSDYPSQPVADPVGPSTGVYRVLRGGSWFNLGGYARSASRYGPDYRYRRIGFRFALGQGAGR